MAAPALRRTSQDDVIGYTYSQLAASGRTALAKPRQLPRTETPGDTRKQEQILEQRRQRTDVHRSTIQHTVAIVAAATALGGVFLYGHIALAREAYRSVAVSNSLNQAIEQARYWQNARAREVTPSTINQKAAAAQMIHPEEADTIIVR